MVPALSQEHLTFLIRELRLAAIENQREALDRDDGGYPLCLGAALANDAADALQALVEERTAPMAYRLAG
ncbi:hypothetical protein [Aureimonas mangrovi]|uniref:hypothetical protein n=1 Tax=Aureimonas mangrovi TaxID=2758041 RepID=UPI00163D67C1|nr:hypothetical protein [Aureimonas mangrovi]